MCTPWRHRPPEGRGRYLHPTYFRYEGLVVMCAGDELL